MSWSMIYNLDAAKYAPLQMGTLAIRLTNQSTKRMIVTHILLQFDWMGNYRFERACNVKIEPNEALDLPDLRFGVDLGVSVGSHNFKPGISYKLLEDNQWITYTDSYVSRGDFIEVQRLPPRDYTVFVSHSNARPDTNLIQACKDAMRTCGLTGYFAEDDAKPGITLWDKIAREIMLSDAFLVLWTKNAAISGDVREEIGIAIGAKKQDKIVPMVERGIEVSGSLKSRGIEWVDYVAPNHTEALSKALGSIMGWAAEKEARQARRERIGKKGSSP